MLVKLKQFTKSIILCRIKPEFIFLFFLFAFFNTQNSYSQRKLLFDRLTINDGLSQSSVKYIVQDKKGFMWFGTEDGLNKYDGYEFTIYKNNPADSTSISDNNITSLQIDNSGTLWIATFNGGLNIFDPVKEEFKHIKYDSGNTKKDNEIILAMLPDHKGYIWIGTYGRGLIRFNPKENKYVRFISNPDDSTSISSNNIFSLYEDKDSTLWIGTMGGGVNKYNRDNNSFSRLMYGYKNDNGFREKNILAMLKVDNTLWIGTMESGLDRLNLKTNTADKFLTTPTNSKVSSLLKDEKGNLWVGTYKGLRLHDKKNTTDFSFVTDTADKNNINAETIRCIYKDGSGIIWIGTHEDGIYKYVPSKIKFDNLNDAIPEFAGKVIFSISESSKNKDEIWLGTFGSGLAKHNFKTGNTKVYIYNKNNQGSISSNFVQDITEDEVGNIWIAMLGGSLDKYERRTDRFIHYSVNPNNENSISSDKLLVLYADKKGSLWIGTLRDGLERLDLKTNTFTHFKNDPGDTTSISNDMIKVIHEDKFGNLWIGTNDGLNKLVSGKNKFVRYIFDKNKNSISNNIIQSIYEEPGGELVLWIGTYGGGLNKFDVSKNKFTSFKEEDGLPNNSIYEILADKYNNLWISTNKGLTRFNPKTKKFRNYDINDGLLSNEFNAGASFIDSDGKFYFGNVKGVNCFYPDSVKDNPFIPPIVITKFQKFNKDVKTDTSITELNKLVLSYSDYVFSFEFAVLDYSFPSKNNYQYMLEGFEKNWNDAGSRRYVTYTNLDPGEYVFRVRGSNSDNVWNEAGTKLNVIITPPFWLTTWFRILMSLLFISSLIFLINRIKAKEKKKTEVNKKIYDLKIAALASQMKPHFVFNTINSIQYLISEGKQKEALTYLSKFSELLRMTLENSLKSTVSLEREIQFLKLYLELEKLRFEDKFDYNIDVDEIINIASTEIPVMCIQPYVENAVIHGFKSKKEKGELRIIFRQVNSSIKCSVMDNGVGYKNSVEKTSNEKHKSLGMTITKERIELLSSNDELAEVKIIDLKEVDNSKTGTKVEIILPMEVNY